MNLYLVQYESTSWYVEAPDFASAIQAWADQVRIEWGNDYQPTDQPESVACVHDEPVVRWRGGRAGRG